MHPPLADFAPTYPIREAAARVAATQTVQARQRQDATQGAVDANRLPLVPSVFFPQTGDHVSNRTGFLDFWRANGQVLIFGYPISEETMEDRRMAQYFERALNTIPSCEGLERFLLPAVAIMDQIPHVCSITDIFRLLRCLSAHFQCTA